MARMLKCPQNARFTQMERELRDLSNRGWKHIAAWYDMTPYWQWVTLIYGPELDERFGGLEMVDSRLLPLALSELFRGERVKWQE